MLLAAVALLVASPSQALAATKTGTLAPGDQAKSYAYYKALRHCFDVGAFKNSVIVPPALEQKNRDMSQQNALDFEWFHGYAGITAGAPTPNSATVGVINEPDDGDANCGDSEGSTWIKSAAALWGYSSGPALLCALGFTREVNGGACTNTPSGATNNFQAPSDVSARLDKFWTDTLGGGSTGVKSITDQGGLYRLYLDSFMAACRPSSGGADYTIQTFAEGSSTPTATKYAASDRDRTKSYEVRVAQWNTMTCGELAKAISAPKSATVAGYAAYLYNNDGKDDSAVPPDACLTDPSAPACQGGEAQSSCTIPDWGWILCPALTTGANIADSAYGFLADSFLKVDTELVGPDTLLAFNVVRNIANVILIIVFLWIIYLLLTSTGNANRLAEVKKMMLALVVMAVLANVGFYLCQVAVDVSNIAGYSLKSLFTGIADQVLAAGGGENLVKADDQSTNFLGIVTTIIAAGALVWLNVGAVIVALAGALVALLVIFFILAMRKALIVLLVVVAPVAFVLYVLPNTRKLFTRWKDMFISLLAVFPLVGLVYGACYLAYAILWKVAQGADEGEQTMLEIIAYIALVVPLIVVIPLLRSSLSAIGNVGTTINSIGAKLRGQTEGGVKRGQAAYKNSSYGKFRSGKRAERKARIAAGTYTGAGGVLNPRNARSRVNAAANQSQFFNKVTGGFGADRDLAAQAQNRADQKAAIDMFGGDDSLAQVWAASGGDAKHASFATLSAAQQGQFRKMVEAGHHRKAASFLASAQYLSDGGKGTATDISQALARAKAVGASDTAVGGAEQAAIAGYRKSGRGDMVAQLQSIVNARAGKPPMTLEQGWGEIAASSVHREGIDATKNPTGRASYETYLRTDREATRQALAGFDSMEARARRSAESAIVAAAQMHEYGATGATPTISTIQDAKTYFGVK